MAVSRGMVCWIGSVSEKVGWQSVGEWSVGLVR